LRAITREGYTTPTPIQTQTIPHLLAGKDLIGIAQTGTGKTAAFVLPLLQKLSTGKTQHGRPRALVLAPTRELAAQIAKSCATYGAFTTISCAVVYGGVPQGPQVKALARGADILVATPGRLFDLMQQKMVRLDDVHTLVLDEADRMLDMGFVKDIRTLAAYLPKTRQTIMFSATMSRPVSSLANDFLRDPIRVDASPDTRTIDRIKQELFYVEKTQKLPLLLHLMGRRLDHVLVFTRTKAAADKVARALAKEKIPAQSLHGDKSQSQRTRVLEQFRTGKIVLVATDVAARGIDVDGISHIINYDLPNDPENYVHRIGRTARAGAAGTAYSFCDETEKDYLKAIERVTKLRLTHVDHMFHSEAAKNSTQKIPPQRRGNTSFRRNTKPGAKSSRNERVKGTSFSRKVRSRKQRSAAHGRKKFFSRQR